jgi:hypothetical protein
MGEGTVMDSRIVTDRLSRRSKGWVLFAYTQILPDFCIDSIGYVEFRTIDLVEKALALSGTVVMGLPIMVQLTEAERNRTHAGDGQVVSYLFPSHGINAEQESQSASWSKSFSWIHAVRLWFSVKIRVIKSSFLIDYTSGLCTSI